MVDFNRRRTPMVPSRSMPMSVLNERERSGNSNGMATSRAAVRRLPARSQSDDNGPQTPARSATLSPPHQHQHDTHGSGLVLSSTPAMANPYSSNRVKARRTQSHGAAAAKSKFLASRERSSSPSKDQPNNKLCPSSPTECLMSSSSKRRGSSSFGILKAILRALALIFVGFGAGMAYNMWQAHQMTNGNHIMDLESIPSVLLTDELVKKLAQDNQLQEAEIQTLKQQVEEARKMAQEREKSESENPTSNKPTIIQSHEDIPDNISIGGGSGSGGRVYKHKKGLRTGKRFVRGSDGHAQEVPFHFVMVEGHVQEVILDGEEHAPEGPPQSKLRPPPEQPHPQSQTQEQAQQQQQQQHVVTVPALDHYLTGKEYQEHYQQQHQQHQESQESFHTFLS